MAHIHQVDRFRFSMRVPRRKLVSGPSEDELAAGFFRTETLTRHRLRHLCGNVNRAGLVGRLRGGTSSACAVPVAGSASGNGSGEAGWQVRSRAGMHLRSREAAPWPARRRVGDTSWPCPPPWGADGARRRAASNTGSRRRRAVSAPWQAAASPRFPVSALRSGRMMSAKGLFRFQSALTC